MNLKTRLQRLRQGLAEKEIDAIFVSQPENRHYLSGFDGSSGYLLITPQSAVLATDFRYLEQAKTQAPDYEIFKTTGNITEWFPGLTTDLGITRLGFEARHVTFSTYLELVDNLKPSSLKLVPLYDMVESFRAIKEPEEIEFISRAATITDSALDSIEDIIQAGMTEKEAAWEIEKSLREKGSQSLPFEIIVASGPNSALPHAKPSTRTIKAGEPVVIDIGARYEGYCSDLTRTICLSSPDDFFGKIYDIVLGAQLTALAIIKEGMTGEQTDSLAREVIEQAGYGHAFGHGLGHGIGLAPHETPRLGPKSNDLIASGMVFTIEPGIYVNGWGGVRIEDMVLMEKGKIRVISAARKVRT